MRVTVDQEGKALLEKLLDLALRNAGIKAFNLGKQLENCLHMEPEVDEKQKSSE